MKRLLATLVVAALFSASVYADVTIVQKTTLEGGMMAMAPGGPPSPTVTTKIKGLKARAEVEMANAPVPVNVSTITDLAARQVVVLMHDQKTAQVVTAPPGAAEAAAQGLKIDGNVTRTGRSQVIDGFTCEEYSVASSLSMAESGAANMRPEVAAMMKDMTVRLAGSIWVAKNVPGSAEYVAFQKAAVTSQLGSAAMGATGMNMPGMESLLKAMTAIDGVPYLTEIDMTIEGTGQMAEMMRKMGSTKVTTRVTSITAGPLSDELFTIPAGYTKQ